MAYEAVIGIEVHAELATETKLFCGCRTQFGAPPNSQTCPVCLGLPGVLPVLNRRAFEYALKIALALECRVDARTSFDRKNYYYPDLPKNYQISQSYHNLGRDGHLDIICSGAVKRVGIWNVHLEEDAGKLVHPEAAGANYTLVDLNRAGMPLLEMVSAPDMRSSAEVDAFMRALRNVLLYTEVADCRMQEGKLRFEPSISLRPAGEKELGARVEIKNVGSIGAVVKAVDFEIARQTRALETGEKLSPETRLWDESLQRTAAMRRKETSADYRYFPEPDLVRIEIDERWKEEVRASIPELPVKRRLRLQEKLGLSAYHAGVLTDERELADYFEECVAVNIASAKTVANIFINEVQRVRNEQMLTVAQIRSQRPPRWIAELAEQIEKGVISVTTARELTTQAPSTAAPSTAAPTSVEQIVRELGLAQISDESAIAAAVDRALAANAKSVADYKAGKKAAFNALLGSVMRETKGKANPQVVRQILEKRLAER